MRIGIPRFVFDYDGNLLDDALVVDHGNLHASRNFEKVVVLILAGRTGNGIGIKEKNQTFGAGIVYLKYGGMRCEAGGHY